MEIILWGILSVSNKMKLTIPTNWDDELILSLIELNKKSKNKVVEVFGSKKESFLGSSRPSECLPFVTDDQIKSHIQLCKKKGIKFNYLINSLSYHNQEFDKKFRNELVSLIKELISYGVDSVTIANPLIIEVVRSNFPDLYIGDV